MTQDKIDQNIHNVRVYLNKVLDTIEPNIDNLGNLDDLSKLIKKFVDNNKKELFTNGKKELFGNEYKIKKSVSINTEIKPDILYDEINTEDFFKCVKVIMKNVGTFLTKDRIDSIKEVTGETEKVTFEKIK